MERALNLHSGHRASHLHLLFTAQCELGANRLHALGVVTHQMDTESPGLLASQAGFLFGVHAHAHTCVYVWCEFLYVRMIVVTR